MIPKEIQERYVKLKNSIHHYRTLYHVYDKEEISQAALDSLKHELVEIEAAYQDVSTLLARLLRDPGDIAALQKLAAKQTQLEQLEAAQSAMSSLSKLAMPLKKSHVA